MAEAFISYAREDRDFVDRLAAALDARGRSLWIDRQKIQPLTEWFAELVAAIANAEHFLIVLSPDWLESRICPNELEEATRLRKALVPLHWRDVDPERVPEDVRRLHWIDFRDAADFERSIGQLLDALDRDLERVREQTRLLRRALDWKEQGRRRENLLSGEDLAEAERFLGEAVDVPETIGEYVQASRANAHRIRTRRRLLAAALSIATIVAAAVVFVQRRSFVRTRAEREAGAIAAKATDLARTDRVRALLHAIEACRIAPTQEAKSALWAQLAAAPNLLGVVHQQRHITATALHPDGNRMAVGDLDGRITIVDVETRRVLGSRQMEAELIRQVVWIGDGDLVAIRGDDGSILFLETGTGDVPRTWRYDAAYISAMAADRTGRWLAIAHGNVVEVRDLAEPRPASTVFRLRRGEVRSLAFSPDGSFLAAGAADGAVYLYSMRDRRRVADAVVREHFAVGALAFSPDGMVLAAGSDTGTISLLRTSDLQTAVPQLFGHTKRVTSLDFDRAGTLLLSGSDDATLRLWAWRDSDEAQPPLEFHQEEVVGAAFRGRGDTLVSAGESRVLLWRTARYRELIGHTAHVSDLAWTRGGALYSSSRDGTVRAWSKTSSRVLTSPYEAGRVVAVAPDGSFVASTSWTDGSIVTWPSNAAKGALRRRHAQIVRALAADERNVYSAAEDVAIVLVHSPSTTQLAAGTADGRVLFYDLARAKRYAVPAHASPVRSLSYSADGSVLMSQVEDGQIAIWDPASRLPRFFASQPLAPDTAALSPDGGMIAAATPMALALMNVANGERIGDVVSGWDEDIARVAFSPDGDTLAVASGSRIQLLEASPRAWMRRGCAILGGAFPSDSEYARVCGTLR